MFIYKEYYDRDAYGEEITIGFTSKLDAVEHLIHRVEGFFKQDFDDVKLSENDTIREDYVSFDDGNGVHYWVITSLPVVPELGFRQEMGITLAKEITDKISAFWDNVDPYAGLSADERDMSWQSMFEDLLFGGSETMKQLRDAIFDYEGSDEIVAGAKELIDIINN